MAEWFNWYKETLIFLKGNKVLLLLVTTAITGAGTQTFRLDLAEKDKIHAIHEVAKGFQSVMSEKTPKIVVQKPSCGECLIRIKKLERWH